MLDEQRIDITTQEGVNRFEDRNGNSLSFTNGAVIHSSGRALEIVRDREGRIDRVRDHAGREIRYEYDGAGDLIGVTNPLEQTTSFEYRVPTHPHHLTDLVDHRGVRIAAMTYTGDGRLDELCDADGVCFDNDYDLVGHELTRYDGLGRPTRRLYSDRGEVSDIIDGLGNVTQLNYDVVIPGRLVSRVDGEGNVTRFEYTDGRGNLTARVSPHEPGDNPADFTTSYTYDSNNRLIAQTSPGGGTLHYELDAEGNRTAIQDDAYDVVASATYDDEGRVLTQTTRFGVTAYTYSSAEDGGASKPATVTEPDGAVSMFAHDADGRVTRLERASGGETITQRFRYDAQGRRQAINYGNGVTVEFEYGHGDEWTAIQGPTFGRVQRTISGGGRLLGWTTPQGETYGRNYDVLGNLRLETDPNGRTRTYEYDDAQRPQSIIDSVRGATTYAQDAAGRVTAVTDASGGTTSYVRAPSGRIETRTDPRLADWTSTYTPARSESTNPLGATTATLSTNYGLFAGTELPSLGGAPSNTTGRTHAGQTSFDDSSAYPLTTSDAAGRVRSFSYTSGGILGQVTDLAGIPTTYEHQVVLGGDVRWDVHSGDVSLVSQGARSPVSRFASRSEDRDGPRPAELDAWTDRLTAHVSPLGERTEWSYDDRGRVAQVELPYGGEELRSYTPDGRLDVVALPQGVTLDFDYDTEGRVISRTGSDGSLRTYTYDIGSRLSSSTNATGTITYDYDAAGRLTELAAASGATFVQTWTERNQVSSIDVGADPGVDPTRHVTQYEYDLAGNLVELTDPQGDITEQDFDLAGRLTEVRLPNGVVSTYGYDEQDRITSIIHTAPDGTGGTVPVAARLQFAFLGSGAFEVIKQPQVERGGPVRHPLPDRC